MKRTWLYFCSAASLAELCSTWLQSFHHASDVPFAVTYTTQAEFITDRLFVWFLCFFPLMIAAYALARRNSKR
jgi:hypothetical protein